MPSQPPARLQATCAAQPVEARHQPPPPAPCSTDLFGVAPHCPSELEVVQPEAVPRQVQPHWVAAPLMAEKLDPFIV